MPWPEYQYFGSDLHRGSHQGHGIGGDGLESLVKDMVERYVKESEREEWVKSVVEGEDVLRVASLLLRSLRNVARMGFDGFELVDPGVGEGRG